MALLLPPDRRGLILQHNIAVFAGGVDYGKAGFEIGKARFSVRKHVAVPDVPVKVLLSVGSLASFGWLLSHDLVHPIVIYALQLFLSF